MKRVLTLAVVLVSGLVVATAGYAGTDPAGSPAASPAEVRPKTFVGVVVSVNTSAMTLVVKGKTVEMTFDVAAAKYATGTKLEELKTGDNVGVEYVVKAGKNVATLIGKVRPRSEKQSSLDEGDTST